MTFADWVAEGSAFGIKAFFALFVFLLCVGIVVSVMGMIAALFRNDDDH